MATVNVTSWAEFIAAVAVAGDTVVCPDGAVWDLTESEPITEPLEIACSEIQGNGTTIKGATFKIRGYSIRNTNSLMVDALHCDNIYAECVERWWKASADLNLSKSKVSGQFINTSYYDLFVFAGDSGKKTNFTSCAMNVSCPNGGNLIFGNNPNYGVSKFCRYMIFTTNATTSPFMYAVSPFNYCEKCELILSVPNASRAAFDLDSGTYKTSGCVIRGTTGATKEYNLPTWDHGYHNWLNVASTSLGCTATVGTHATYGGIFCTDSQMRNAEYIAQFTGYNNARFPLGDGDEDWHTGDIEWNGGYPYIPKMIDLPHLVLRPVPQNPYITVFAMNSPQSLLQTDDSNGLAILTPTSCEVTEELNGAWTFSMQHPIDTEGKWEYLKLRNILKIAGQLFTILTVEVNYDNNSGYLSCSGEHIWYQIADGWIFPGDIISGATGAEFITNVKARTVTFGTDMSSMVYDFTGQSDIVPAAPIVKDCSEGCTPIDALIGSGGLVDQDDSGYAELYRDNFNFSINKRMENALDNAFDIRIGRDLRGIRRTFDTTQFVSYFGCYDRWGNYFAVSWVLNQFMARNFPHHIIRTKTFADDNLDVFEFGFAPLITKGMAFFRRNCKPIISYEIDLEDVRNNPDFSLVMHADRLKVGDSGTVYDERLGGKLTVRLSGTTYDAVRDKVIRITVGDQAHFSAPAASTVEIEPEVVGGELYIQDGDGMFIEDGDGKLIYQEVIGDA